MSVGGSLTSSSGLNGVTMLLSDWLALVGVIAILLTVAHLLEGYRRWVCNGLAVAMAWVQSEFMTNTHGLLVGIVTWWTVIGLAYVKATGYTPIIGLHVLHITYRQWRKLEWSGTFVHPKHDRI